MLEEKIDEITGLMPTLPPDRHPIPFSERLLDFQIGIKRLPLLIEIADLGVLPPDDLPGGRRLLPQNHPEQGRFSGAVRSDDPDPISRLELKAQIADQNPPFERFGKRVQLQNGMSESLVGFQSERDLPL